MMMTTVSLRTATFTLVIVLLASACSGNSAPRPEAGDGTWALAGRPLPPPLAASDALRMSIEGTPQPDVAEHRRNTFATTAQWAEAAASDEERRERMIPALAVEWSVKVTDDEIAGVTVRMVTPDEIDPANEERLFVHVHGGAYVFGGGLPSVHEAILIAGRAKIRTLSIDYRMPPEHPFPAAVDDVVAVWKSLLAGRPARKMALGGTSAGGGLTLAATHRFKQLGLELPGALWAGTPWADLTKTGDSQFINEGIDRALVSYEGVLEGAAKLYADGHDLRSPLISPVYGNFESFPPTSLVTGTRDLFLSDVVRVHRKMRRIGVIADLNVYEGSSHADYIVVVDSPESEQVYGELGSFLSEHLE